MKNTAIGAASIVRIGLVTRLAALLAASSGAADGSVIRAGQHTTAGGRRGVQVSLRPSVIDLYHPVSVRVSGIAIHGAEVRLLGANDRRGLAYEWKPYPWRCLGLVDGTWRCALPAPPLLGIYQLQLRLDAGHRLMVSPHWLVRVFAHGIARRSFPTPVAAVRDFVARLPGGQDLVALRRWPQASFDHRDPRLHRIFTIAYAPRKNDPPSSRLGLFVTTIRNGFRGRWLVLEATVEPYE